MITLTNGHVQNASNLAVPNGSLELTLNTDATVIAPPYGQVMGNIPLFFKFDANANLAANAQIWSNIELNPQNPQGIGTWYLANFYDANGARINSVAQQWQFTQLNGSTVDIGTMTSTSQATIYYPAPITQGNTIGGTAWINAKASGAFGDGFAAPLCGHMAIGSTTLTLNTTLQNGNGDARFAVGHVGYQIVVPFAAAGSKDLYTTIASYVSPTQVTLTAANASGLTINNVDVFWWPNGRDDTAALQGAINTASETASLLYLPSGVYPVSASLTNTSLLRGIIGDGRQSSWIVSNSASNTSPALVMTDVPYGFQLSGIGFKGRGQAVASGTENGVEFRLTQSTGVTIARIHDLRILNYPGHGLYIQEMITSTISDSIFDDVGNTGLYLDVGTGGFGGTSVTISGCYSYDNSQAYYLNNYAYSVLNGCAADSNNTNYWLVNCASVVLIGCGSEVPLGTGTIGYVVSGGTNNALYNCYWTKVPATDGVGVAVTGAAVGTIIDGFRSNQPSITPLVDISIGASAVNTVIRNLKSVATTPISDAGTNTFIQSGNEISSAVLLDNIGNSTLKGSLTMASSGSFVPAVDLNNNLGSSTFRWANVYSGNFFAGGTIGTRFKNTGVLSWSSTTDPTAAADTGISRDSANVIMMGNGTQDDSSASVLGALFQSKRFKTTQATTLVSGDFAISGGWGNTASLAVTNLTSKDSGGEVTITSNGTGLAANPTCVLTFHDGNWGHAPAVVVCPSSTVGTGIWAVTSVTATAVTFTYIGTPAGGGQVYSFSWVAIGT